MDSGNTPAIAAPQRWRILAVLLRLLGVIDLLAVVVVGLPLEGIESIHRWTGLEPIPAQSLVEYLIRATAMMYGMFGALLIFLSLDVARFRPVIRFLGALAILHGTVMTVVDRSLGMPWWWCAAEGPIFAAIGIVIVVLSRPYSASNAESQTA